MPNYYVTHNMYHAPVVFFYPTRRWRYQITPAPSYYANRPSLLLSPYSNKEYFMQQRTGFALTPPLQSSSDTSVHQLNYPHDHKKPTQPAVDATTGKDSKTTGDGTQDKPK